MKGMKKRGLCLALSLYIVAGSATNSYASASVVIGGGVAVGVEYAFAWLLGAVGLTAASVAVYENADSIKAWGAQQNREFCQWVQANADAYNEWADVTEDKINDWCDDLANGTIRKGSSVWQAFKAWASSIYVRGGMVSPPASNPVIAKDLSDCISGDFYIGGYPSELGSFGNILELISVMESYLIVVRNGGDGFFVYDNPLSVSVYKDTNSIRIVNSGKSYYQCNSGQARYWEFSTKLNSVTDITPFDVYISPSVSVLVDGLPWDNTDVGEDDESYSYVGGASNVFDRDGSLDNVDLVGVGSDVDAKDIPVVWPGNDALVDILAGLAAGAESWSQVLEDAGVVPVDLAGDTVVDDEGVTDEPIAGVIPPLPPSVPSELKDYTVDGLSDLFPFCLPFDLIDFLGVLAADPVAPCFTWTFYYPSLDGMKSYDFEIDLSPFNSVAQLLRDMECILFVVGLILITRDQMIKG